MGARTGPTRDSGRVPADGRDRYEVSWGRSFLISECTTAASWWPEGSFGILANAAPPHTSARAVVAPTVQYARRLPIETYEILRLSQCGRPPEAATVTPEGRDVRRRPDAEAASGRSRRTAGRE